MFASKISRVIPLVLGIFATLISDSFACQEGIEGPAKVSSRWTFSDSNQRNLTDISLSEEVTAETARDIGRLSSHRKLPAASRKLTDNLRNISDIEPSQQTVNRTLTDIPCPPNGNSTKSELRILPSRRVLSDAKISNVHLSLTDQNGTVPKSRFQLAAVTGQQPMSREANRRASRPSLAQSGPTDVAPIGTGVSIRIDEGKRTVFLNPQENGAAPNFVDPESFRVSPSKLPKASAVPPRDYSAPHTFRNASVRRSFSNWQDLAADEDEIAPNLDSSSRESTDDSVSRNMSDDEDDDVRKFYDREKNRKQASSSVIESNRLPTASVNQGIGYDPLMNAFASHTIGDPYIFSRSLDPGFRYGATPKTKTWRSPNLKHRPLYFEDAALERHGQSLPKMQPVLSAARFYSSVLLLPQKQLVTPPYECVYPVGHDRPGDCTPRVREINPRRGQ